MSEIPEDIMKTARRVTKMVCAGQEVLEIDVHSIARAIQAERERATKCHDDLVAALAGLLEALDARFISKLPPDEGSVMGKARAALSKATEVKG